MVRAHSPAYHQGCSDAHLLVSLPGFHQEQDQAQRNIPSLIEIRAIINPASWLPTPSEFKTLLHDANYWNYIQQTSASLAI